MARAAAAVLVGAAPVASVATVESHLCSLRAPLLVVRGAPVVTSHLLRAGVEAQAANLREPHLVVDRLVAAVGRMVTLVLTTPTLTAAASL